MKLKTKLQPFILPLLIVMICLVGLTGCLSDNSAGVIQHNISKESDYFETYRKVTVVNLRSDKVLLEIEGYISIQDSTSNELAIIIKTGHDQYKMHYVYTGSEIVYLVEQLENTHTDPYHWKIKIHAVIPDIDIG